MRQFLSHLVLQVAQPITSAQDASQSMEASQQSNINADH